MVTPAGANRPGGHVPPKTVGSDVGSAVGARVGMWVGVALGSTVGVAVGEVVGECVGVCVGIAVGKALGAAVGAAVGDAVGEVVGLRVGIAVGAAVGIAVGAAVGIAVGTRVGDEVGATVVGDNVTLAQLTPDSDPVMQKRKQRLKNAARVDASQIGSATAVEHIGQTVPSRRQACAQDMEYKHRKVHMSAQKRVCGHTYVCTIRVVMRQDGSFQLVTQQESSHESLH